MKPAVSSRYPDNDDLWLGIDFGTQSVKAIVVDGDGEVLFEASAALSSSRNQRRHEQDPLHWIDKCSEVIRRIVLCIGPMAARNIRAVATCSTSGTIATVAANGFPTGPGIMYDDNRAEELFSDFNIRAPEQWEQFGAAFQPSWALAKIIWLQRNGMPAKTAKIVHQTDVVSAAMTGHMVATDWSSALKSGYGLEERKWPEERFLKLGVDCAFLPQVVAPGQLLGVTSLAWQRKTFLPAGIPVVAGTTDGCAAQIGAGALEPGDWHTVIGTTLVFKGVGERPVKDESGVVYSHLSPDGKAWLPGGASNVGAGAISALLPRQDLNALAAESAYLWGSVAPDSPICYPLLGVGERFPLARPDARGFVVTGPNRRGFDRSLASPLDGHRSNDTRSNKDERDLTNMASILIGVACVERLGFEVFSKLGAPLAGRLTTSGGGSRSLLWNRFRSSMLNSPIHLMKSTEGALGMAILAAWAVGGAGAAQPAGSNELAGSREPAGAGESLSTIAMRMNRVAEVIDPDSHLVGITDEHFHRFKCALVREGWIEK